MRIALVCPYAWQASGGVQVHVKHLAVRLRDRGHETVVLAPTIAPPREPWVRSVGRPIRVPYRGTVAPIAPLSYRRTRGALTEFRPDVVHVHEPLTPSASMFAALASSAPVVATVHAYLDRSVAMELAAPLLRRVWKRVAVGVAVSEAAASFLRRALPGRGARDRPERGRRRCVLRSGTPCGPAGRPADPLGEPARRAEGVPGRAGRLLEGARRCPGSDLDRRRRGQGSRGPEAPDGVRPRARRDAGRGAERARSPPTTPPARSSWRRPSGRRASGSSWWRRWPQVSRSWPRTSPATERSSRTVSRASSCPAGPGGARGRPRPGAHGARAGGAARGGRPGARPHVRLAHRRRSAGSAVRPRDRERWLR